MCVCVRVCLDFTLLIPVTIFLYSASFEAWDFAIGLRPGSPFSCCVWAAICLDRQHISSTVHTCIYLWCDKNDSLYTHTVTHTNGCQATFNLSPQYFRLNSIGEVRLFFFCYCVARAAATPSAAQTWLAFNLGNWPSISVCPVLEVGADTNNLRHSKLPATCAANVATCKSFGGNQLKTTPWYPVICRVLLAGSVWHRELNTSQM